MTQKRVSPRPDLVRMYQQEEDRKKARSLPPIAQDRIYSKCVYCTELVYKVGDGGRLRDVDTKIDHQCKEGHDAHLLATTRDDVHQTYLKQREQIRLNPRKPHTSGGSQPWTIEEL